MSHDNRFRLFWTPFLRKQGSRTMQAVGLSCPPSLGSGGDLTLHIGGHSYKTRHYDIIRYPTSHMDQNAAPVYLWPVPHPSRPTLCRVTWRTPLGYTCRDTIQLTPAQPQHIHVVYKTHLDLGYTAPIADVIRDYQTGMLDRVLDLCEKTADRPAGQRFVWTMPTWQLEQSLDADAVTPERRERLIKCIRSGQVVWGLMAFTTHTEFFGREEMCRSLYAARRLAERFKLPVPTAAKLTDVPAHTASLAMAFTSAGGNFFQIGTNPDCQRADIPQLFWWKLPDESRILCHYHGAYGTALLPPPEYPHRHWLALQSTNDNVGPPEPPVVDRVRWIAEHFDYPKCTIGRLEDFADAVIRDEGKNLPTHQGEPVDWWIYGIASQARPTAIARRDKDRLPAAEIIRTLADWAAGTKLSASSSHATDFTEAYRQMSLYTEHTWGDPVGDADEAFGKTNRYESDLIFRKKSKSLSPNLCGTGVSPVESEGLGIGNKPPIDRWVKSWVDKAAFAEAAHALTDRLETDATQHFARHLAAGKGDAAIVLYNVANWKRGGLVRMPDTDLPAGEFALVDPTTGGEVLYHRDAGEMTFLAPIVPACGYLALEIRPGHRGNQPGPQANWDDKQHTLHFESYSLQFHKAGGMARWHDRARSMQWCSNEVGFPMGAYLYEMPGNSKIHRFARSVHGNCWEPGTTTGYFNRRAYEKMTQVGPVGGGPATIRHEIYPLFARVIVEAECSTKQVPLRRNGNAKRYRTTFTVYRGWRDLHVKIELLDKQPTFAAEAGYAFFPFTGTEPFVLIDRIAHLIEPGQDLMGNVNAAHMVAHHGVRFEYRHAGMNFYPLDTPLVGFGAPGAYHFDANRDYENAVAYATLFNNCWGTNFAQWQSGDFAFEFALRPTGNDEWDGGLARGGVELFRPLVARVVRGLKADPARSLLQIDPAAVQLVALKPSEFEPGYILRLWNSDVDPIKARFTLPRASRGDTLTKCDMLERPTGRKLSISPAGEVTVPLRSHELATFILKTKK